MKTYPTYKDSNVDWLGKIPEHWELKRLGAIVQPFSKRNQPNLQVLSVYRDYGVIKKDSRDDNHNATSLDTSNYKVVHNGDLVVNKMKAWQGSMGISSYEGIVSPAYITCNVIDEDVHSHYLHKIIRSSLIIEEYIRISYGVRVGQWDMHWEDFKNVPILIPPKHEQQTISNFLDETCGKLDTVVAQKETMIALLKERKQALIQKAVTRGLNENVTMKDSGVEWIGEIPENWEVMKLKFISNSFPSNVDKHSKPNETKVRLCNYTDVYKNEFITDNLDLMIATATKDQISKFSLKKGDIVITKDSETASDIAEPAYVSEDLTNVICGYHLAVIQPNEKIIGRYLFRALQCKLFNAQFEVESNGITRVGLGTSDMKKARFLVPPKQEQEEIVNYIDAKSQKIDQAVKQQERAIVKLKEYKASLIDSCVLGKIKVSSN